MGLPCEVFCPPRVPWASGFLSSEEKSIVFCYAHAQHVFVILFNFSIVLSFLLDIARMDKKLLVFFLVLCGNSAEHDSCWHCLQIQGPFDIISLVSSAGRLLSRLPNPKFFLSRRLLQVGGGSPPPVSGGRIRPLPLQGLPYIAHLNPPLPPWASHPGCLLPPLLFPISCPHRPFPCSPADSSNVYEGIVSHVSRLVCASHAEANWVTKQQEQVAAPFPGGNGGSQGTV